MRALLTVALLQAPGPSWSLFWGLLSAVTLAVMAIGAWAIRLLLSHRERTMIALATGEATVDLKLSDHRRDLEVFIRSLHAENVATNKQIVADLKEVASLLYGARGSIGVAEEVEYNRVVRHGVLEHLQALEIWALQTNDVEGMPTYIQPRPIERRRRMAIDEP